MKLDIKYKLALGLSRNKNCYYPVIKLNYDGYNSAFETTVISVFDSNSSEPLFEELNIRGLKDLYDVHSAYMINSSFSDVSKYLPDKVSEKVEDIYDILSFWSEDANTPPEIASDIFREYVDEISDKLNELDIDYEMFKYEQ